MNQREGTRESAGVLEQVVKVSSRLPAPLAYGVLIMTCLVLLAVARVSMSPWFLVLLAFVVLAALSSFVYWDSRAREQLKSPDQITAALRVAFGRKTFEEPLRQCKRQNWADRFRGTCEAYDVLKQLEESVVAVGSDELKRAFEELRRHVDGYRDDIAEHLLKERRFPKRDDGDLDIPEDVEIDCEGHRTEIRRVVDSL